MNSNELLKINVNGHTEKKNGLTYLSWAWAWAEVLKVDPQATYEVVMFDNPDNPNQILPYQSLGGSCMVWVKVTLFSKTITVQLPVLDYRNKCIPAPNAFDINTSIMRCLTKGIAMHGLGLYIYAGEDLPMDATPEPVAVKPVTPEGEVMAEVALDTGDEEANAKLFAEGMIQYTSLVKDVKGLNSYWKANQHQLDTLKGTHPGLYADVLAKFTDLKKQLSQPQE